MILQQTSGQNVLARKFLEITIETTSCFNEARKTSIKHLFITRHGIRNRVTEQLHVLKMVALRHGTAESGILSIIITNL